MPRNVRWLVPTLIILLILPLFAVTAQDSTNSPTFFATNTPFAVETTTSSDVVVSTPVPTVEAADVVVMDTSDPIVLELPPECEYIPNQSTSQACIEFMTLHPEPDVEEIIADNLTLGQYSFWRVGPQAVTTYDAPGGNAIGVIPEGFNFVNVVNQVEGWIQSETGQWISENDAYFVNPTYFRGVLLPEDWRLPFGWVLDTTGIYASKYPGGPSDPDTGLIPLHYQLFNIYAEATDSAGWVWYLVGPDQWVKQVYMTVIQTTPRPAEVTGRWVAVDLFEQSLVAYENDRPLFATLISTGLPGTETNEGLFEVWARLDRDAMSGATGAPNAYALQSVPWVQYFDDSISIHGTYWHDLFGYRRSRGCVNLSISDAKWVYDFLGTAPANRGDSVAMYVYVHSSQDYR